MIKPIMKDEAFLAIKSAPATKMDTQVAQDLKDTLQAYSDQCVGMAANMIGVSKNIIIFAIGPAQIVMSVSYTHLDASSTCHYACRIFFWH